MSSEAQVALVTGVFTLAGLLGGAVIGWFTNRSRQARSEKRAAFLELLAAIDACSLSLMRLRMAAGLGDREDFKLKADLMMQSIGRVDAARTVVALILPATARSVLDNAVMGSAQAAEHTTSSLKATFLGTPLPPPDPSETTLQEAFKQVLELAKEELGYR